MTIGERIKKIRIDKGLTQKQVGQLSGMADSAIRKYELGVQNPKVETIQRIADALGVSASFLIGFDEKIVNPTQYSPEEIKEIQQGAWDAYKSHIEESTGTRAQLLNNFYKLNDKGQQKAVELIGLLAGNPEFQQR